MSLSKNTAADVKRDQGLMFLRDLKQSGMLEDLLNVISRESTGCAALGAMSDASKRRCPDESASHEFEFLHDPEEFIEESMSAGVAQHSMPVMPKSMASPIRKLAAPINSELPEGVSTFEEWGRTICDLPKVKDLEMSYRELVNRADAGDRELAKYLGWVKGFNGNSARTKDFKRFLLTDDAMKASPRQGLFIHSGPFGRSARWQSKRTALRAPGGAPPLSSGVFRPFANLSPPRKGRISGDLTGQAVPDVIAVSKMSSLEP